MSDDYQWYENELNQKRYYEENGMDNKNSDKPLHSVIAGDILDLLQAHNKMDRLRPEVALGSLCAVITTILTSCSIDNEAALEVIEEIKSNLVHMLDASTKLQGH